MNDFDSAFVTVLERLSTLRKTMSDDEQKILDMLVATKQVSEVDLHVFDPGFAAQGKVITEKQVVFDSESEAYTSKLPPIIE